MSADWTADGDQPGCAARMSSAAMPAMCGLDMEVPDSPSYRLPWWPGGETPAMMSTPGAVMSGLIRSPPPATAGPAEENAAIAGARGTTCAASDRDAVGAAVCRYALSAAPATSSTCTVGMKW